MALINCPECGKEISDSVSNCPNCGYELKKKKNKLVPIILIVIVLVIAGVLSYLFVLRPNSIMNQATNLIERGKLSDADVLLASLPSSARKEELLAQICIKEAQDAIKSGDLTTAENKLQNIAADKIPAELLNEIYEQKAILLLNQGKYLEADNYYATLEQTEEIVSLRRQLFYESRALHCALQTKNNLLFPESMQLSEIVMQSDGGFSKNYDKSTDAEEIHEYSQPAVLLHYRAQTRGGSITDSFQRYSWDVESNSYKQNISVDSLKTNDTTPYWVESAAAEERRRYHSEQLEIAVIGYDLYSGYFDLMFNDEQIERVNKALQGTASKESDFIPNNELFPMQTPQIIQVTPKPEN